MSEKLIDLLNLAEKSMTAHGLLPHFSREAMAELNQVTAAVGFSASQIQDLRDIPFCSIDNPDSQDLDQIEWVEPQTSGNVRVLMGIADVEAFVPMGSAIDDHAANNTTSVYTGVKTFSLLPESLCNDRSSLLPQEERHAMMVDMVVDAAGNLLQTSMYPALVRNHAKFHYEEVSQLLATEPVSNPVLLQPAWQLQLRLQEQVASRLRKRRFQRGALDLETLETRPLVEQGAVVDLVASPKNRARVLIEDLMILTNEAVVRFLLSRNYSVVRRVVRTPARWPRLVALAASLGELLPEEPQPTALAGFLRRQQQKDPLRFPDLSLTIIKLLGKGEYIVEHPGQKDTGHFGLAVQDYTHSTAPNRRYADLVTQRIIKSCLQKQPIPYSETTLTQLATHCTLKSNDAQKVERFMRKAAAAVWMRRRLGQEFEALVTGASGKGIYVRLLHPSVEGRVIKNERSLDVGDFCRVKLIFVDPEQGFIDFERISP